MSGAIENTVWARAFVDELVRCGLRDVVVAPGSRSTPIVMACSARKELHCRVHLDERSAAFFALGIGKATGRPAAVVTTSGTAVANLLPAVVEASQAGVPLLVLTADRPPRLRGADANQAIDQIGIFGAYPRAFFETAASSLDPRALRHLRAVACRAWAGSVGTDPGPVHVNMPFDKPLEPIPVPSEVAESDPLGVEGRPGGRPFTTIASGHGEVTGQELSDALTGIDLSKAVVVAGLSGRPSTEGAAARAFAAAIACPLLADALSGARYGGEGSGLAVAGFDLFLRDPEIRARLTPSAIIRLGRSPVSAGLQRWLFEHESVPQVVIGSGRRWKDHGATAAIYLDADVERTLREIESRLVGEGEDGSDPGWTRMWADADAAVRSATGGGGPPHEGDIVAAAAAAVPDGGALFVSSSMPIRDVDAFVHPSDRTLRVLANRGASGIDGVVSSAFGVASTSEAPVVCVIGDVAFFHDQNGLLWSRETDAPVVFVLIDNDGGGIFEMLPISEHEPAFTKFFATPHGLDFSHGAAQYGIAFTDSDVAALPEALRSSIASGRTVVVRVRTKREENVRRRSEVAASVVHAVRDAIGIEERPDGIG